MIYFITARAVGLVKIGHARNPQTRFVSIQTHSPVSLSLERVTEGGLNEERALHEAFADARERGEWFNLTPEIEAHMTTLPTHEWRQRGWHSQARNMAAAAAARKAAA